MFPRTRKPMVVVVACLLCLTYLAPDAFAGIFPPPSELEGEYAHTSLGANPPAFPVSFTLTNGTVEPPNPGSSVLDANNLNVTITNLTTPVSLGTDFKLTNTTGTIDYHIVSSPTSPNISTQTTITMQLTLVSNTSGISLVNLNPARVILTFPGVDFDPSWPPDYSGPVFIDLKPLFATPEPASMIHVTWVGVLGLLRFWTRQRRGRANVL